MVFFFFFLVSCYPLLLPRFSLFTFIFFVLISIFFVAGASLTCFLFFFDFFGYGEPIY